MAPTRSSLATTTTSASQPTRKRGRSGSSSQQVAEELPKKRAKAATQQVSKEKTTTKVKATPRPKGSQVPKKGKKAPPLPDPEVSEEEEEEDEDMAPSDDEDEFDESSSSSSDESGSDEDFDDLTPKERKAKLVKKLSKMTTKSKNKISSSQSLSQTKGTISSQRSQGGSSDDENSDIYTNVPSIRATSISSSQSTPGPKTSTVRAPTGKQALFQQLQKHADISDIVDSWIKRYKKVPVASLTELINLIIAAAGHKGKITVEQFEAATRIEDITKELNTNSYRDTGGDYALNPQSKTSGEFTKHYTAFWEKLVSSSKHSLLFDEYFVPTLTNWAVALSRSSMRPFRHAATLASLKMISSLCGLASDLRAKAETLSRQMTSKEKIRDRDGAKKIKDSITKTQSQIVEFDTTIDTLFKNVFEFRWRDVHPVVRKICVNSLAEWMHLYDAVFLDSNHLKYFGWVFNDKDADCREASISAIIGLLENEELAPRIVPFIKHFWPRILTLPHDVNSSVASTTIQLLTRLSTAKLLEASETEAITKYMWHQDLSIRQEAASFVKETYLDSVSFRVSGDSEIQAQIRVFLGMVVNSDHQQVPNYAVDALWSQWKQKKKHIFKDWKAMTDLLLFDHDHNRLSTQEQTALCRVLSLSCRKALGEPICPKHKGERPSRESAANIKVSKDEITAFFSKNLSSLLTKFQHDKEKIEALIEIIFFLDLQQVQNQQEHQQLVEKLGNLYQIHSANEVLVVASKAFQYLLKREVTNPFVGKTDQIFAKLCDDIVQAISDQSAPVLTVTPTGASPSPDPSHSIGVETLVNRLLQLVKYNHVNIDYYDHMEVLLLDHKTNHNNRITDNTVALSLEVIKFHLNWLHVDLAADPTSIVIVDHLRDRRDHLLEFVRYYMASVSDHVRQTSFRVGIETLIIFSPHLQGHSSESMRLLAYRCGEELHELFLQHWQDVFDDKSTVELDQKEETMMLVARAALFDIIKRNQFGPRILMHYVGQHQRISEIVKLFHSQLRKLRVVEHGLLLDAISRQFKLALKEAGKAGSSSGRRSSGLEDEEDGSSGSEEMLFDDSDESENDQGSKKKKKKKKANKRSTNTSGIEDDDEPVEEDEADSADSTTGDHPEVQRNRFIELCKRIGNSFAVLNPGVVANASANPSISTQHLDIQLYYLLRGCFEVATRDLPRNLSFFDGMAMLIRRLRKENCPFLLQEIKAALPRVGFAPDESNTEHEPFFAFVKQLERRSQTPAAREVAETPEPVAESPAPALPKAVARRSSRRSLLKDLDVIHSSPIISVQRNARDEEEEQEEEESESVEAAPLTQEEPVARQSRKRGRAINVHAGPESIDGDADSQDSSSSSSRPKRRRLAN